MMPTAEQHEIRQCRRAAVGPVADVMRLAEAPVAAREATSAVAMEKRASQRRRDRARLGADVEDAPVGIVLHHDSTRVAAEALGRFGGNARTRLRRPTGRAAPDRSVPRRRRARPPGSARPASPDRSRGAARSRRGAAARPPVAAPSSAFPRRGPAAARRASLARCCEYRASRAAVSAFRRRAPASGDRRPRIVVVPSSFGYTWSARLACCRRASSFSALRSMRRQPRTMRSTCSAVPARPMASNRASVSGVATRVRARTLAYDSSPRASAWASRGSVARARATRTFSRAAPRSRPTRQESHSAQDRKPVFQPPRASKSRIRSSRRAEAASRCVESSAIASPMRSSAIVEALVA